MGITLTQLTNAVTKVKGYCTNKFTHENITVLEKFTEDENSNLLYDGKEIGSGSSSVDTEIVEQVEANTTSIQTVATTVNSIAKYQKYLNTELDSCSCKLTNAYTTVVGEYIPFIKESGSFEVKDGRVVVKPGQRVQINVSISYTGVSSAGLVGFYIKDYTNDTTISQVAPYRGNQQEEYDYTQFAQYTNDTDKECEIGLYVGIVYNTENLDLKTTMTVQEINRQITIDPLEHVNESQGVEDTPVGHIISHMGTVAPKHYLICDGSEYNIADYPYLAQHMIDNFGTVNYFGGDGTTTFTVPDLRGEFLRGTGTATRDTGSGGEVGEHQDGTTIPYIGTYKEGFCWWNDSTDSSVHISQNRDKEIYSNPPSTTGKRILTDETWNVEKDIFSVFTIRPTNTSVLYCIKYEPTYFMVRQNTNYMMPTMYSENERVVGCWIDGKPLYEKTVNFGKLPNNNMLVVAHNIADIDVIYSIEGIAIDVTTGLSQPMNSPATGGPQYSVCCWATRQEIRCQTGYDRSYLTGIVTLKYTKTTDSENSFTTDMIKDYIASNGNSALYTDEEISTMTSEILGGAS